MASLNRRRAKHCEETLVRNPEKIDLNGVVFEFWSQVLPTGIVGRGVCALMNKDVGNRHVQVSIRAGRRRAGRRITHRNVHGSGLTAAAADDYNRTRNDCK